MPLITFDQIDNFAAAKDIQLELNKKVIATIRELDEREQLEPFVQGILHDTNETPHGPAELVDILTHKVKVCGKVGLAAFILKGKSFPVVRPKHVSHQIYRLEKIADLKYSFFLATGNILDEAKEQFVATSQRLNCDYAILDAHDVARLLIAFGFICPRDGIIVRGGRCQCGYTPKNRASNILQQDALTSLREAHDLGQESGLVILPTGAGKTRVAVRDIKRQNASLAIYTAHSHEILDSAEQEFRHEFREEDIFRSKSGFKGKDLRKINLISIQTLVRNLDIFSGLKVDYLVFDEFHHAAALSYRNSLAALRPKFLLGLTATPFRGDRKDVIELCSGNVVVNHELRTGIETGILCPYHYFGCFDNVDYSKITWNGSRYDIRDLEKALIIPERDQAIIKKWNEKSAKAPTLAFCCSHEHAIRVKSSFQSENIPAAVYLSDTDPASRSKILESFSLGKIKILCVVDILNEGVDLPFVECLLFLRPTDSKRIFFQQLGRGLRHYFGKHHCVVIDFIGNFQNAYRILEYQGLDPYEDESENSSATTYKTAKEILNLPTGCKVEFDERVIGIFGDQTMNPAFSTRHNIARILLHQFKRFEKRLGRLPTKIEVDRSLILGSKFYIMVFGSWKSFMGKVSK